MSTVRWVGAVVFVCFGPWLYWNEFGLPHDTTSWAAAAAAGLWVAVSLRMVRYFRDN